MDCNMCGKKTKSAGDGIAYAYCTDCSEFLSAENDRRARAKGYENRADEVLNNSQGTKPTFSDEEAIAWHNARSRKLQEMLSEQSEEEKVTVTLDDFAELEAAEKLEEAKKRTQEKRRLRIADKQE